MTSRSLALAAALAGLAAAPAAGAAPPGIDAVAFLAGRWIGGEGDALSEETWSPPEGRSMLGMWRYVRGGEVRVAEILTLSVEEGAVVLRLRHFDGRLVAREDRDRPLALPLVAHGPGEARFEGPGVDGVTRTVAIHYRRTGDRLEATLEKDQKRTTFEFRRAPP